MKCQLNSQKQKLLEKIINTLVTCTDIDQSREIAETYFDTMEFQGKAEKLKKDLLKKRTLIQIQKLVLDVHLSGEGHKVL